MCMIRYQEKLGVLEFLANLEILMAPAPQTGRGTRISRHASAETPVPSGEKASSLHVLYMLAQA